MSSFAPPEDQHSAVRSIPSNPPRKQTIVDIDCSTDPAWAQLPSTRRNELFVDPRWFAALTDTYGFTFRAKVIEEDGAIIAALPYCEVSDQRGDRVVSLPFCDLVDAPATNDTWARLLDSLDLAGRPIKLTTPAEHPATDDVTLHTELDAVFHRMHAERDDDELLASYAKTTRQLVRSAPRKGLSFRATTDRTSLRDFHRLHVGVRKYRHGLLAQPFGLFEAIAERFFDHGLGVVIRAEHDGEMVGGCLLVHSGNAWHYKFSVSHPDYRSKGVSHGSLHAAIQFARDQGSSWLDLGCSDFADAGLIDFKRRFGPEVFPLASHTRGSLQPNVFSASLNELVNAAVQPDVADELTTAAGDTLYRFFA